MLSHLPALKYALSSKALKSDGFGGILKWKNEVDILDERSVKKCNLTIHFEFDVLNKCI